MDAGGGVAGGGVMGGSVSGVRMARRLYVRRRRGGSSVRRLAGVSGSCLRVGSSGVLGGFL
jgi:hypothetical protein